MKNILDDFKFFYKESMSFMSYENMSLLRKIYYWMQFFKKTPMFLYNCYKDRNRKVINNSFGEV